MTKLSHVSLMILLTFCGLVHGQDVSVDPLAKGGVGSSSQQDGNTTGQQEKEVPEGHPQTRSHLART